MAAKKCKTCGEVKALSEFYKHPNCPTGLGSCKVCRLKYVSKWYQENKQERNQYRERYRRSNRDKERRWHRTMRRKAYRKYPQKFRAWKAVYNAKREGQLSNKPCEICGTVPAECHHEDYSKPLQVRWLCHKHHKQLHRERKAA